MRFPSFFGKNLALQEQLPNCIDSMQGELIEKEAYLNSALSTHWKAPQCIQDMMLQACYTRKSDHVHQQWVKRFQDLALQEEETMNQEEQWVTGGWLAAIGGLALAWLAESALLARLGPCQANAVADC